MFAVRSNENRTTVFIHLCQTCTSNENKIFCTIKKTKKKTKIHHVKT